MVRVRRCTSAVTRTAARLALSPNQFLAFRQSMANQAKLVLLVGFAKSKFLHSNQATMRSASSMQLLDELVKDKALTGRWCCNELGAGYAADGYARVNGVGCCVTTFTVGGLSVINAVAGASFSFFLFFFFFFFLSRAPFCPPLLCIPLGMTQRSFGQPRSSFPPPGACAERLPLICISGGPNSNDVGSNRLIHHTVADKFSFLQVDQPLEGCPWLRCAPALLPDCAAAGCQLGLRALANPFCHLTTMAGAQLHEGSDLRAGKAEERRHAAAAIPPLPWTALLPALRHVAALHHVAAHLGPRPQVFIHSLADAHEEVDKALSAALTHSKPVYICVCCNLAGASGAGACCRQQCCDASLGRDCSCPSPSMLSATTQACTTPPSTAHPSRTR